MELTFQEVEEEKKPVRQVCQMMVRAVQRRDWRTWGREGISV